MTSAHRSARQVLLIEDNAADARLVRELLKYHGASRYEVTEKRSLREAIEHLTAHRSDVIVLDLSLPDAAGLEAVTRISASYPRVPMVVLTEADDQELARQVLREGAQDSLGKMDLNAGTLVRALDFATERAAASELQSIGDERALATLKGLAEALVSTDPAGAIMFFNQAAEQLTGWTWNEARGRPLAEVVRVIDTATRLGPQNGGPGERRTTQFTSNFVLARRDGTQIPVDGSIAPLAGRDGQFAGEVLVFRDATATRAAAQKMVHSAHHDPLTGLPNRVLLNDRINSAISIAPRHDKKVAVLFMDLDGFKGINDTLGHAIGDQLLQAVAGRLMTCVRGSDTVSRLGGDEFVVLLSEVERPEDSAITARRMLEAVSQPYAIDHHELKLTASIGVSTYPEDGNTAETLIRSADAAMYQAKENGRHGYQFFKPAMNLKAIERQDVEKSLRHALEQNEFSLHFQPKVNLRTGEIAGAEALLRWEHPERGLVPPSVFVPVAESSGLIQPIGNWVMREACRQTQEWYVAGLVLPSIAVNVSTIEFSSPYFLDGVFDVLNGTGLDPRILELELTESALMKQGEATNSILHALRSGGVQMSVDDFGTGYSNLSHLSKFPIHTLKIDQSFVSEITVSEGEANVVAALLGMAHSLNLRVVAEGVETPEQLAFLQHHRCDEAQGYYFSQPLPAPQFGRLLRDGLVRTMAARQYARPSARADRQKRSA